MPSSDASASAFSAFTSATVTPAPRACRARAVASPRPEAPPTTRAELPSMFIAPRRRAASADLAGHAPGQAQREQLLGIGQPANQLQPRRRQVSGETLVRELGTDLRAHLLARLEAHRQIERAHERRVRAPRSHAHLDPLVV